MNVFLVMNLFSYEYVIQPPINLPENMITVYITDNEHYSDLAKSYGWNIVKITDKFLNISDRFERRVAIGYIKAYPHKIVPEILEHNLIFVCDSNIVSLWLEYKLFVNNSINSNNALFVTSGCYQNNEDNISSELDRSLRADRWSYNHSSISKSAEIYKNELLDSNIEPDSLSIVSAKYVGWDIKHEKYEMLSDIFYNEVCKNLQSNIILTYMSGIYKDIYNYHTNALINSHKFNA
jgi:hypothetical protein